MKNNRTQWEGGKPPQRVLDYVEWLVMPEGMREPRTKQAYADEHDVNVRTLREWEKDDRVRWVIRERSDSLNMSPERVQAVMNALYAKAAAGDVQATKLYLDHVDKLQPRDGGTASFEDMSDEELAELAKEVLNGNSLHA